MKNPTSLAREQNLQNWSKIISEYQFIKRSNSSIMSFDGFILITNGIIVSPQPRVLEFLHYIMR